MSKLTQAQIDLLAAAAAQADSMIDAPKESGRTAASLIKRGFMMSLPQDGGASRLLITAEGRAAIQPPDAAGAAPPADEVQPDPAGKLGVLVGLMRRPNGATIEDLTSATGWQKHSVRGAISGSLKKKLGLTVTSEKGEAGRVYRLVEAAA